MSIFLTMLVLCGLAAGQAFSTATSPTPIQPKESLPFTVSSSPGIPSAMPPLPKGKSTVIGGAVRKVDRVRDELTLAVFGARDIKVLFDERTSVFRDGRASSLDDLKVGDHVSLETMLDGSTVFVRSIHMVTGALEGQCRGQVLSYDRAGGELTVRDSLSNQPVKLRLSADTAVIRKGQAESSTSELQPGSLVAATFVPDNRGRVVAHEISILAAPGSMFVFTGNVVFLDLHSGALVVVDPRDQQRYEIVFDSAALPESRKLHEGSEVVVNAYFDGSRYSAQAITVNPSK